MNLKKILSSTLVFFLSSSLIFSTSTTVSAATNDVFGITATFKNANETNLRTPNATFAVGMGEDKELGNDFAASVDLYIPLPLLSNQDSSLIVRFSGNINRGPGFAPTPVGIFDFGDYEIKNNNGTYVVIYPGSDIESASATEIVGDYAKVHLTTNMDNMVYWAFNGDTFDFGEYIPNPDNHCDQIAVIVHSSDVNKEATIYIDNLKLISGTTTLLDTNFSNLTDYEWLMYATSQFDDYGYKDTEPVVFNQNLLKLSKKSVNVKIGEKVAIEATATPEANITYKSNKKKIAKVDAKGIVTGVKTGTAKIKVTANGITKTFKVKVAK